MANINFPFPATTGQQYTFAGVTYTYSAQGVWSPSSTVITTVAPQGRLTLQSGVPVMSSSQTGSTIMYYTPYVGDRIPIYNGVNMVMTAFPELIGSTVDVTKNPGPIGVNKINDWFVWNDNGTIRIGHGPDWTDNVTRSGGTVLLRQNGIFVNSASITNGPAAARGTYVGTTRSDAASHLEHVFGSAAPGGGEALLSVWNCYNRILMTASVIDTTSSWSYSSNTVVPLNFGVGGGLKNRMSFVSGLAEDINIGNIFSTMSTVDTTGVVGLALDITNNTDAQVVVGGFGSFTVTGQCTHNYKGQLGWHFIQAVQYANGPTTYYGTVDGALSGLFRM